MPGRLDQDIWGTPAQVRLDRSGRQPLKRPLPETTAPKCINRLPWIERWAPRRSSRSGSPGARCVGTASRSRSRRAPGRPAATNRSEDESTILPFWMSIDRWMNSCLRWRRRSTRRPSGKKAPAWAHAGVRPRRTSVQRPGQDSGQPGRSMGNSRGSVPRLPTAEERLSAGLNAGIIRRRAARIGNSEILSIATTSKKSIHSTRPSRNGLLPH